MIVGMMRMEVLSMNNVNRFTRASKNGKLIICPQCNSHARVFHFSWSALNCIHCDASVNKNDWRLASAN